MPLFGFCECKRACCCNCWVESGYPFALFGVTPGACWATDGPPGPEFFNLLGSKVVKEDLTGVDEVGVLYAALVGVFNLENDFDSPTLVVSM